MNCHRRKLLGCFLLLVAGSSTAMHSRADALAAVQMLREGGCGGTLPPAPPVRRSAQLDRAAEKWAAGSSPAAAADRSGYEAETTASLHIRGPESSTLQLLRQSGCRTLMNKDLRDIGVYRRSADTWIVMGAAYAIPAAKQAPVLASRALQLINEARARGMSCGEKLFAPAPPVKLSGTLGDVASGHARDMAQHDYFEHQDLAGHSPADRVRAVGYREKLVGENIAYGPKSADEVVQGWLHSPDHCENIMDPRFAEMGIAYAPGQSARRGLYWVQLLVEPRA